MMAATFVITTVISMLCGHRAGILLGVPLAGGAGLAHWRIHRAYLRRARRPWLSGSVGELPPMPREEACLDDYSFGSARNRPPGGSNGSLI